MLDRLLVHATHAFGVAAAVLVASSSAATAQTSNAFTACTTGALSDCAVIRLSSQVGIGPGGTNFFEIALANLGSQTSPSIATSIYNVVFGTATGAVDPGLDVAVAPAGQGGATVRDASAWDLFDSGDAIFLSALTNNGVGGCVAGAAIGGFGQAGQTCGTDSFMVFSFFTPREYDPNLFRLLDLEVVGLTDQLPADGCGGDVPCAISAAPVTPTPEPGTMMLAMTGLSGLAGLRWRRRRTLRLSIKPTRGSEAPR